MKISIKAKTRRVFKYKYYRDLNENQRKRLDALRERKAQLNKQMKTIKGPFRRIPAMKIKIKSKINGETNMTMSIKFISWEKINDKLFKVVIERQQSNDIPTLGHFQEAVEAVLGFGFKVRDNISEITSSTGRCYDRLILEVISEEIPAEDTEALADFGKISAKVYRNKGDDSLWTVVKSDDGSEKLVRNETIDATAVMKAHKLQATETEVDELIEPEVFSGDYASFIDEDGEVKEGFVANDEEEGAQFVIDEDGEQTEIVSASQYLDVVPSTVKVLAEAVKNFDEEDALAAIKKLYGDVDLMSEVKKYLNRNVMSDKKGAAAAAITKNTVTSTPAP